MIIDTIIKYPNKDDFIRIKVDFPIIDYNSWKRTYDYHNDNDLLCILNMLLKQLDATREINGQRVTMTNYFSYIETLNKYYRYLVCINNQIFYNIYLDKLIKRHTDNIYYEYNNPIIKNTTKKVNRKNLPNKFFRYITKNLFTGENIYIYENPRTKEKIESDNANLLDELNAPKRKIKNKVINIPLNAMTFNFNKDK